MLRPLFKNEVRHLQEVRKVETDSFYLAALLPLSLRNDEDCFIAPEECLEEGIIWFIYASEGSDILKGALECGGHLTEERAAVLDLEHPYLLQLFLVGYLQA